MRGNIPAMRTSPRRILLVGSRSASLRSLPSCRSTLSRLLRQGLSAFPPGREVRWGGLGNMFRSRPVGSGTSSGPWSSSASSEHSEVPVARSSVRVVFGWVAPPPSSVRTWSHLRVRPSDAGSLGFACGPRRPPARSTSIVPAEAGATGVATPLRSSPTLAGRLPGGRAFLVRPRLGFPRLPARSRLPSRAGPAWPRPGRFAPGRGFHEHLGFPWGSSWVTPGGGGGHLSRLRAFRLVLPSRDDGEGVVSDFPPSGLSRALPVRSLRVSPRGSGPPVRYRRSDRSLLRGRVRGRALSGWLPRARSHRLQGFHPPASP